MNLSAYQINTQYQKVSLEYEAKVSPVKQEQELQNTKNKEENEKSNLLSSPIIYANQSDLSDTQNFQKLLMQKILSGFGNDENQVPLFPNDNMITNKESYQKGNPYNQDINNLPQSFLYNSSSEYYEKTTIDFTAQAIIKTPTGEYNIEVNFSYTREFYEKNETQIEVANKNFEKPIELEVDNDDSTFKDLKSLHFIFDILKEDDDKKNIFEQVKELLEKRREAISEIFENKDNENNEKEIKPLDNFQVWQETSNEKISLIAAKKDGIGIFLANSNSESSMINLNVSNNGYSLEASYSSSQTTYMEVSKDIKAEI